jgi:hypothetical protein
LAKKTQLEILLEAEKKLTADLAKLRSQIRLAERGQNKRIKDTNKYIQRALKSIVRSTKQQEQIQEKELEKLERFLGESFETLAEAKEALQKQTRKATKREVLADLQLKKKQTEKQIQSAKTERAKKKAQTRVKNLEAQISGRKLNPEKATYTVRQLSNIEKQNIIDFLTDKKSWSDIGNGYLKPNERITVSVPYRYIGTDGKKHTGRALGRKVFKSFAELQSYMVRYMGEDSTEDFLGDIEIIRFNSNYEYDVERGKQTDVIEKRRKDVKKMFQQKEKESKRKAIQKARESERRKAEKQREKLQAKINKLKGQK